MKHVVIGTAGHIDHGKSTLVLALTGTDPDRLQEEKARGITIDLGFAHTIENGIALSFVDVPGHERFVRNMLAGVGGMDLVMLHVAADESVMPQTREHFEICRLLRVPAGLVVITKSDLADTVALDVVRMEVCELVTGSFLEGAPVIAVSARTGAGMAELRRTLGSLAAMSPERPHDGPPRLAIDRVFSMKGFGTVVTGTLIAGRLGVDEDLVLQPSGRPVKVRGLQVHGERMREAVAGQRVAANLAGAGVGDVTRGDTLTAHGAVSVTRRIDVRLDLLSSAKPLPHGARVRFHQGTRELLGRAVLAHATEVRPGESAFARLHLEAPAVLVRGDRFILRAYSPLSTIAGGTVLDPLPPRRGIRTAAGSERFVQLANESEEACAVMAMVEEGGLEGLSILQLSGRAGLAPSRQAALLSVLQQSTRVVIIAGALVSSSRLADIKKKVLSAIGQYHADHPLEDGMPRGELRERLFGRAPAAVCEHVLGDLVSRGLLVARERVALAGHGVALSPEEIRVRDALVQILAESGLKPPDPSTLAARIGTATAVVDRTANLLVRQETLVRLGDLLFHESALNRLKAEIRALRQTAPATIDVAGFKDRYKISRKHAIPLLEFLDRERITRRVGDVRQIL